MSDSETHERTEIDLGMEATRNESGRDIFVEPTEER
jgi:hypothetical protein